MVREAPVSIKAVVANGVGMGKPLDLKSTSSIAPTPISKLMTAPSASIDL
jgi:hypothetical protein